MAKRSKVKVGHEPLRTEVKDGKLVVSMGIFNLAWAAKAENGGPLSGCWVGAGWEPQWARDVARALSDDDDAGNSILTEALDSAMREAMDAGSEALTSEKERSGE